MFSKVQSSNPMSAWKVTKKKISIGVRVKINVEVGSNGFNGIRLRVIDFIKDGR